MMRIRLKWITTMMTMATATAIGIGFFTEIELVWGLGIGLGLFYYILLPALYIRDKNRARFNPDQFLTSFNYSLDETKLVAATILDWQKKGNRWIAPFTAGCLGMTGGIFLVVLHAQFPETPFWQWLWLLLPVSFPFITQFVYFFYLRRIILKVPCMTIVGRNFLKWGNMMPVFNEREDLKAIDASLVTKDDRHYVEVLYWSISRLRYGGKVEHRDRVLVLVPLGFERPAQDLVALIRSVKEKQ